MTRRPFLALAALAALFGCDELLVVPSAPLPPAGAEATPMPQAAPAAIVAEAAYTPKWRLEALSGEAAVEEKILEYTNDARAEHGLPPLVMHPRLRVASRFHLHEMLDLGYSGHTSPVAEHAVPTFRARHAGYFGATAENLNRWEGWRVETPATSAYRLTALDETGVASLARKMVDSWMNSEGHRKNMLHGYHHLGVGVVIRDEIMVACQNFGSQAFEFTEVTIKDTATSRELTLVLDVNAWTDYDTATLLIDGKAVDQQQALKPDERLTFKATLSLDGVHVIGFRQTKPGAEPGWAYGLTYLRVDGSKPLAQAIEAVLPEWAAPRKD